MRTLPDGFYDGATPEKMARALLRPLRTILPESPIPAVNVASVPQLSPLRYPGGKTWLIPHIRVWLKNLGPREVIIEPFAGGAVVSLLAVVEQFVARALMVDMDRDVAAFWRAALQHTQELIDRIADFEPTRETVRALESQAPNDVVSHGFRTLVLNRTRRGGILAPGASLTRSGENGAGIGSRWYPETLCKRLRLIGDHQDRISFFEGDGLAYLESAAGHHDHACFFLDPPYTTDGGKRAGARLYAHNDLDHVRLFELVADTKVEFLMTYDCSPEVIALLEKHRFHGVIVAMKNGHHAKVPELVITRQQTFA